MTQLSLSDFDTVDLEDLHKPENVDNEYTGWAAVGPYIVHFLEGEIDGEIHSVDIVGVDEIAWIVELEGQVISERRFDEECSDQKVMNWIEGAINEHTRGGDDV